VVAATATLLADVPCAGCGYDLRGLPPDGRCPECGGSIPASLAQAAAAPLAAGDDAAALHPWWRREMILAASTALAAAVVPTVAIAVAVVALRRNGESQPWLIVVLAAAWVLQWYAALKFTTAEPGFPQRRRHAADAWLLRVSATLYLLIPFVYGLLPPGAGRYQFSMRWLVPAAWLVLPSLAALFFRIRFLFRRLGLPAEASNAAWLGFLLAGSLLLYPAFSDVDDDTSAMELMVFLPSYQIGAQMYVLRMLTALNDLRYARLFAPSAAVSLLCVAIEVRLLVRLLRTAAAVPVTRATDPLPRRPLVPAASEAETGRRSGASSFP
jgi:hypothetical protein